MGAYPIGIEPANGLNQLPLHPCRWCTPVTTGKPVHNTAVLPVPLGWIPKSDPHGHEDGVVATRHTHVMPALLGGEHGRLGMLQGNSPQILLALGVHY